MSKICVSTKFNGQQFHVGEIELCCYGPFLVIRARKTGNFGAQVVNLAMYPMGEIFWAHAVDEDVTNLG